MMLLYSKLKARARQIIAEIQYHEQLVRLEKPKLKLVEVRPTAEKWHYACSWCRQGFPAVEMVILETDATYGIHKWRRFCRDTEACEFRRAVKSDA